MRLDDCYRKRMLKERSPNPLMSGKAMEMAYQKLNRSVELDENGFHEEAVVASYSGMFQAARALLFKDGVTERSHYCVILYLRKNYRDVLGDEMISWLDMYRNERHAWFYGVETMQIDYIESKEAIERSSDFIEKTSEILEKSDKRRL